MDRRAAERRRTRAAGAFADRHLVGVALDVMDLIGVDAEPVAEQLLVDGFVPLALGDRARQQGHRAAAVEADFGRFEAAGRGALDRVRDADAAQFAAPARFGAALLEPGEIGEAERHVEALLELAAIVGEGQARFERHRLGRDHVAPAQFDRVDAELGGGEVDHPLDDIGRLGAAVAAIGPHRVGVRIDGGHVGIDRRRAVDAGQGSEIGDKSVGAGLRVGADGRDRAHAQAEKMALGIERQLGLGDVVAGLRVAEKGLGARARPFDRPPRQLGGEQYQRDLVVDRRLHAKAAADVAGDDAHLALRHLEDLARQFRAVAVGALQGRVDRVMVGRGVVVADAAARLHRGRSHPVDDEFVPDRHARRRQRRHRPPPCRLRGRQSEILSGHSSQTRGAPGSTAASVETIAGSGSYSTSISSAASASPDGAVSATTKAT